MAERERPGQIRVHRGFLKADGREALWPEGARVGEAQSASSKICDKHTR